MNQVLNPNLASKLKLILVLILLNGLNSFAQVQWIITDQSCNEPIPFVLVSFLKAKYQAVADENGLVKFENLNISENDSLILNAIGVNGVKIPYTTAKFIDTLKIARKILVLDEVQVFAPRIKEVLKIGDKTADLIDPLGYEEAKRKTFSLENKKESGMVSFFNGFTASSSEITVFGLAVQLKHSSTELLELSIRLQNPEQVPFHIRIMQYKEKRMKNNKIVPINGFEDIYFEQKSHTFSDWQTIRFDSVKVNATAKDILILFVPTKEFANNKYGDFYLAPYFLRHKKDGKGITRILMEKDFISPYMDFQYHPSFEIRYIRK